LSSPKPIMDCVQTCKANANNLRALAGSESDNNTKKLLLEAAHHLDVSVAELDYIVTSSTVAI
jgi:hypothetical protein